MRLRGSPGCFRKASEPDGTVSAVLTYIDLVVGVLVAVAALGGWRRGLTGLLPRLVGVVAGATNGALSRAVVSPTATALVQLLLELGLVLGSALESQRWAVRGV